MKDLIMDAIVHFKGKWPEGATHILTLDGKFEYGLCEGEKMLDIKSGHGISFKMNRWKIACTREEFEARLQELRKAAPEGATHYVEIYEPEYKGFAYCDANNVWQFIDSCSWYNWVNVAVPLPPEQEHDPEKWMPKVGQECEAFIATDHNPRLDEWVWCIYVGNLSNGGYVLEYNDGSFDSVYDRTKFRPIRTEAEKERDQLASRICGLIYRFIDSSAPYEKVCADIAKALLDADIIKRPTK